VVIEPEFVASEPERVCAPSPGSPPGACATLVDSRALAAVARAPAAESDDEGPREAQPVGSVCPCGGIVLPGGECSRCLSRRLARDGMPQPEVDRVVLARVQLARKEARERDAPLAPSAVLALQRHAGNQAVVALLARQATAVQGRVTTPTIQREGPWEGESAGCGFCIDPAPAGQIAHEMIQSKMGAAGVDNELKVAAGTKKGGGRLDLGRWDETTIEIGEIKPGNDEGMERGRSDLAFYKRIREKSKDPKFKDKTVKMLGDPAPSDQTFPNPGVALPDDQILKAKTKDGVYGYWCEPSNRLYFESAVMTKKGKKGVTLEALRKKKAFFDSDCIRKKTKRQPVEEERIKVVDRAGAVRLAKRAMAIGILQSRAFHLKREFELLEGEHKLLHAHWKKTIITGAIFGGPVAGAAALAAIWTGMPDLEMWAPVRVAADKATSATDLQPIAQALDELEKAIVQPRFQFLSWKARRDGTPPPADPYATPAPATGAGTPPPGTPPPVPPNAADQGAQQPATQGAGAQGAQGGVSLTTIAVLAAVVVITVLLLQPEIAAGAVAAGATDVGVAGAGAEALGAAGGSEILGGAAATTAEAALEAGAEEMVIEPVVGAATA